MILSSETYAKPVFHVLREGEYAAVLESFPYPTPIFKITRLNTDTEPIWRVLPEYTMGFTENMLARTDVMEYMIQASQFVDTTNIQTVRDTVCRLLVDWSRRFPRGVPDVSF